MNNRNRIDHLLSHWLLAAAMILTAAVLTIPQIDRLALTFDERRQYIQSFGIMEVAYTASDALAAIRHESPAQVPLGHLLLHFWGHVAGHALAAARLPFVFAGLMSLAMVYRLTRDFISPLVGSFAIFVLLCHAMYAFYFAQIRYYTLVVLLAAIILWLYLRIVSRSNPPSLRLYLVLAIACAALVSTHVFGFVLYAAVSLYHLIAVRKDWRWLKVVTAALVGLALAAPLILPTLTENSAFVISKHGPRADELDAILTQWLLVNSNGSRRLFAVVTVAAIAALLRGRAGGGESVFAAIAAADGRHRNRKRCNWHRKHRPDALLPGGNANCRRIYCDRNFRFVPIAPLVGSACADDVAGDRTKFQLNF